jgi:organic hydroperoxide reductase OsmC/OhrA
MRDLTIRLKNELGGLAQLGEALGEVGVSIEGGGAFVEEGRAIAHFLVADPDAERARRALGAAGLEVLSEREVLVTRLDQERPGALGRLARRLADARVNIELMYSDHGHHTILGVDDLETARAAVPPLPAIGRAHEYRVDLEWTGNSGTGTSGYREYRRDHVVRSAGKPELAGSSDPHFRGDGSRWNPEELLVAALSGCHLLSYLHCCADAGVVVSAYEDHPEGTMNETSDGGGRFQRVVLRPIVTVDAKSDPSLARGLHERAHALCFIASSVAFPVTVEPEIRLHSRGDSLASPRPTVRS